MRPLPLQNAVLILMNLPSYGFQGTNGAIYSLTAVIAYSRAIALGEQIKEAKDNKGRGGKA